MEGSIKPHPVSFLADPLLVKEKVEACFRVRFLIPHYWELRSLKGLRQRQRRAKYGVTLGVKAHRLNQD
jgi:hypothetical protein